jgi:hypothetical protein
MMDFKFFFAQKLLTTYLNDECFLKIELSLRVKGETMGGFQFESPPFFPKKNRLCS